MSRLFPILTMVLASLLFAPWCLGESKDGDPAADAVYPADLYTSSMNMEFAARRTFLSARQEQLEVTASDYPGLELNLAGTRERLVVPKPSSWTPTRDPAYFGQGGMILAYWGFPVTSGELVSTKVAEK